MNTKLFFLFALLLGIIVFTLQNTESVTVNFFFWNFTLSRALLLFLVLVVGIVLGYLLATFQGSRRSGRKLDVPDPTKGGGL